MRWFLRGVLLIALLTAIRGAYLWLQPSSPKLATSFIVIAVDSMRADHMGVYGYPRSTTPRIDALGAKGIVFEKALSQSPRTKPSVASLFTSTYTSVHRAIYSNQIVNGEKRTDALAPEFLTLAEVFRAGGFATGGFGMNSTLRTQEGFDQGFDGYNMRARKAKRVNRRALSWLRHRAPERFFMYLHYNDPHYPYKPREGYARFGTRDVRVQIDSRTRKAFRDGSLDLTQADVRQLVDMYDGELAYADHHVGELLSAVEEMGYENLLVVVTADHGEEFLDHGDITHGQSLYSELVRVPLIVAGSEVPDSVRGFRSDAVVQIIDIMPTLLDIAGLPKPRTLQGVSFAPLITGVVPRAQGMVAFSERIGGGGEILSCTIFDGRWKLIRDPDDGETMLFDLEADPGETIRLEDSNSEIVTELTSRLEKWNDENRIAHSRLRLDAAERDE